MKRVHNEADTDGETGRLAVEQHETAGGMLLRDEKDVERLIDSLTDAAPFFPVATQEGLRNLQDRASKGEILSEERESNESIIAYYAKMVEEHALAKQRFLHPGSYGYSKNPLQVLKEDGKCVIPETLPYSPGLVIQKTGDNSYPYIAELRLPPGYDTHRVYEARIAEELGLARGLASLDITAHVLDSNSYDIATLLNKLAYSSITPVVQSQDGCFGLFGRLTNSGSAGKYKPEDIATRLVNDAEYHLSPDPIHLGVKEGCVVSLKLSGGRGAGVDGTTIKFAARERDPGFVITISGYERLGKDSWNTAFLSTPQQIESAQRLAEEISSSLQQ